MSNAIHTQAIELPVMEPLTTWDRAKIRKEIGTKAVKITVYVDMAQIACDLGARAAHNKSGRSRYMKGAVIIEADKTVTD